MVHPDLVVDSVKGYGQMEQPNLEPSSASAEDSLAARASAAERVQSSIEYMKQHLSKSFSLASLSAHAALSPSYYSALFKRQTGRAPIEYLTRLRMEQACRLLDNTSYSIKSIAQTLGYADPLYFSRLFRSIQHVSPQQYRKLGVQAVGAQPASPASTPPPASVTRIHQVDQPNNDTGPDAGEDCAGDRTSVILETENAVDTVRTAV